MKDEIVAAVSFLMRLIEKNQNLTEEKLKTFENKLTDLLIEKYKNHWFPEKPNKGQAYRCIRFNENDRRDRTLEYACKISGLKFEDLKLPVELTLWVDPEEVTCRFGEHKGSYCIVASFRDGNKENYIDSINVDELEKKSLERAKQASFEMVNSRKKQLKKYNKMTSSNLSNGLDYSNGVLTSSPNHFYVPHSQYYGSPKYAPHYNSTSPPHSRHNSVQTPSIPLNFPLSPPNRNFIGNTYRGPGNTLFNGSTPGQTTPVTAGVNVTNGNSMNSLTSYINGNKFSRGLHSAFNNAAAVSYSLGPYQQPGDKYHWINKPIVKA